MSTIHEPDPEFDGPGLEDKWVVHVKGAPDRLLSLCDTQLKGGVVGEVEEIRKTRWTEQIATLSSHGLRAWHFVVQLSLSQSSILVTSLDLNSSTVVQRNVGSHSWDFAQFKILLALNVLMPSRKHIVPVFA
jgi:magnesium-transporting ATPase (P-type)